MIRGIVGVVPSHSAEVGRFYYSPGYGNGPWLFQCVSTGEIRDGESVKKALVFTINGAADLHLTDIPDRAPLAALFDVHARIDPTSLIGSAFSQTRMPGSFVIDELAPILCVRFPNRGYGSFDIGTGMQRADFSSFGWLEFGKWSLVIDDEGTRDEWAIATFDSAELKVQSENRW